MPPWVRRNLMHGPVHAVRDLDLAGIDAVGFDLDHTLAVYDDASVNALAYEETCAFLADAGLASDVLSIPYDESHACRGLLLDTATGVALKANAGGQVVQAWHGDSLLAADAITDRYAGRVDDSGGAGRFHTIHSPFDLPTAVFFQRLATSSPDPAALCLTIRRELDRSHTRGDLKRRILDDVERLVRPLPDATEPFRHLREGGKRLFVLTNSEADYATALLDRLFGADRHTLFDAVVPHAAKPRFFSGGAFQLEAELGVTAGRVLYIGDSVMSDTEPARRHGWRTAHVVQELGAASPRGRWGDPLLHSGTPTWFARLITDSADVYAAHVSDVIAPGPAARFTAAPHPLATAPDSP